MADDVDDDDFEAKSGCAICDVLGFETSFYCFHNERT